VPAAADAAAAREICQHCRTGEEIPRRLYECVARALAGATERPAEQQAAAAPQESSRRLGQRGEADRASLGLELGTSG
jgi:flagellar biosynthesis protein FlhB